MRPNFLEKGKPMHKCGKKNGSFFLSVNYHGKNLSIATGITFKYGKNDLFAVVIIFKYMILKKYLKNFSMS